MVGGITSHPGERRVRVARNHEDVDGSVRSLHGLHVVADRSVGGAVDSTAPQHGAVVGVRTEGR